jgi:hypothetical protein
MRRGQCGVRSDMIVIEPVQRGTFLIVVWGVLGYIESSAAIKVKRTARTV